MNENTNPSNKYICGYCGKLFTSPYERSQCEIGCYHKQEQQKKEAESKKKAAEKASRWKEVQEACDRYEDLLDAYKRDYEYNQSKSFSIPVSTGLQRDLERLFGVL